MAPITVDQVRAELRKRSWACNLMILNGITYRMNRRGYTLEHAYAELMGFRRSIRSDREDLYDSSGGEFGFGSSRRGAAARQWVDMDYHGESFHQGE